MNMVVTNHLASYYNVDGKAGVNVMIKKAGFAKKFPALYAIIEGMFVEKVVLNVHLERNDWQQGVGELFALWLNRQLQDTQLQMKDVEHGVWRKIVSRELRLLKDDLEVLV